MSPERKRADPFEALGLGPTLDLAQVKRAYFAALAKHPPHSDPEGFRAVRDAYEALSSPEALSREYALRPVDLALVLRRWEEEFGARLAAAAGERAAGRKAAQTLDGFVEALCSRTLAEVLVAASATAPTGVP